MAGSRRALISVYDKEGVVDLARRLVAAGWEIVSSGGTAATLAGAGVPVTPVEEVTGAAEILDGRVKTLHPLIHGGILARGEEDLPELEAQGIEPFDLVVCNLYPFAATVADPTATESEIIEKIDIGGPAMIRAAAKNHRRVVVVVDPGVYDEVASAIEEDRLDLEMRRRLASEAFFHTAAYDAAIVGWIGEDRVLPLRKVSGLRYGENPHQEAALYRLEGAAAWWAAAVQHQGKAMSFNNYYDAEAAWRLAVDLGDDAVVVVKHTNPSGAARGRSLVGAFEAAWEGDPLAAFGGVVAVNAILDTATAEAIASRFVEVVVAREVSEDALEVLARKKNLRVLSAPLPASGGVEYRSVEGGFLVQERDRIGFDGWEVVSKREPSEEELGALRFAWTVTAHTKSNSIVIANGFQAVGVGAGDQSRVGAAERAVARAGARARGGVAASDAFFPFRDGLDTLAEAGVTAVVEPGGSRNDQEVVDAADEHGIALIFTHMRHFRH
ncbi:MAG: bifunctional phosphoribosylaminoimidazolecarboxamide formyltransferase/IMP cyclohydrolase [Acidimicrobiia bacterium]